MNDFVPVMNETNSQLSRVYPSRVNFKEYSFHGRPNIVIHGKPHIILFLRYFLYTILMKRTFINRWHTARTKEILAS